MNIHIVRINADMPEGGGPMKPIAFVDDLRLAKELAVVMPGVMAGPGEHPASDIITYEVVGSNTPDFRVLLNKLRNAIDVPQVPITGSDASWEAHKKRDNEILECYEELMSYFASKAR